MKKVENLKINIDNKHGLFTGNVDEINGLPLDGKVIFDDKTEYMGEFYLGKFNGKGKLVTNNFTYSGQFKDGVYEGEGRLEEYIKGDKGVILSERISIGSFLNGKLFGNAVKKDFNNEIVICSFCNGFASGTGKIISKNSLYCGEILNNLRHGNGDFVYRKNIFETQDFLEEFKMFLSSSNKTAYDNILSLEEVKQPNCYKITNGKWINDKLIYGVLNYNDEIFYDGEFYLGKFAGKGKLQKKENGEDLFYDGQFVFNQFNGKGRLEKFVLDENNKKYKQIIAGDFLFGMPNGVAKEINIKNDCVEYFNGSFVDGIKDGKAEFKIFDKIDRELNFEELIKFLETEAKPTYIFIGKWKKDLKWGKGVETINGITKEVIYEKGSLLRELVREEEKQNLDLECGKYFGQILNGKPNGKGKLEYKNGDVYEGDFLDGARNGQGVFRCEDGTIYDGTFRNNEFSGRGIIYDRLGVSVSLYGEESIFKNGVPTGKIKLQPRVKYGNKYEETVNGIIEVKNGVIDGKCKVYFNASKELLEKYLPNLIDYAYITDNNLYQLSVDADFKNGEIIKGKVEGFQSYEGDFKNNKYDGYGDLSGKTDNNKFRYIGNFKAGEFNGKGEYWKYFKFTDTDKENLVESYEKNKDKREVWFKSIEGDFLNGKPYGKAKIRLHILDEKISEKLIYAEYIGEIQGFKRSGYGKCCYTTTNWNTIDNNDWYYEGEWKDNKRNGQGEYVRNGLSLKGLWKDDEFVG